MESFRILLIGCVFFLQSNLFAQKDNQVLTPIFRINILNPGLDYELPISETIVWSNGIGIGYNGNLPEINFNKEDGYQYLIAPFFDTQLKLFVNRDRRSSLGKSLDYNSGNYVSVRGYWKGKELSSNVGRFSNNDFFIGFTYGLQRNWGKWHFLFDVGPVYYWDTKGNGGFYPFIPQVTFGYNLF